MMHLVESDRLGEFARELMGMHRLRYRVFKERLDWDVTVSGDMEIDEYDTLNPTYLLYCGPEGRVEGCARLLPTTGPNMLRNSFPALLGASALPESPRIWEASRLCIDVDPDTSRTRAGSSLATLELFAALIEFGLSRRLSEIVAVTDHRMERICGGSACRGAASTSRNASAMPWRSPGLPRCRSSYSSVSVRWVGCARRSSASRCC